MTPSNACLAPAPVSAVGRRLLALAMLAAMVASAAAPAAAQGDAAAPSGDPAAPPAGTSVGPAPTWSNVLYAETSPSQVLDLWIPETGEAPYPLVVFVHGGAFMMGDKSMDIAHIADVLEAGYAAAGVNYRLSGEALFPAAAQDVKAAVRFLRTHADEYGLDPGSFAAWGASAGGNLVSLIGTTGDQQTILDDPSLGNPDVSSAVEAVVAWFPPVDFLQMAGQFQSAYPAVCEGEPPSADAAESPESKYLGAPVQEVPDLAAAANPVTYIETAAELPVFIDRGRRLRLPRPAPAVDPAPRGAPGCWRGCQPGPRRGRRPRGSTDRGGCDRRRPGSAGGGLRALTALVARPPGCHAGMERP